MTININYSRKKIFSNIHLIESMFNIKKIFHVGSILYQRQNNELTLESSNNMDDVDILIGCFILYFSSKAGNLDMPLDIDE